MHALEEIIRNLHRVVSPDQEKLIADICLDLCILEAVCLLQVAQVVWGHEHGLGKKVEEVRG